MTTTGTWIAAGGLIIGSVCGALAQLTGPALVVDTLLTTSAVIGGFALQWRHLGLEERREDHRHTEAMYALGTASLDSNIDVHMLTSPGGVENVFARPFASPQLPQSFEASGQVSTP